MSKYAHTLPWQRSSEWSEVRYIYTHTLTSQVAPNTHPWRLCQPHTAQCPSLFTASLQRIESDGLLWEHVSALNGDYENTNLLLCSDLPISVGSRGNEQSFIMRTVSDLIDVRHSGTLQTDGYTAMNSEHTYIHTYVRTYITLRWSGGIAGHIGRFLWQFSDICIHWCTSIQHICMHLYKCI